MSNFDFLKNKFNALYEECLEAEENCYKKPRTSVFYSRRALEFCVAIVFKNENLRLAYGDNLVDRLNNYKFIELFDEKSQIDNFHFIRKFGNEAVHDNKMVDEKIALQCLKILFDFTSWIGYCYDKNFIDDIKFNENLIPKKTNIEFIENLEIIQNNIQEKIEKEEKKEKVKTTKIKINSIDEKETRKLYIDYLLKKSAWNIEEKNVIEFEVNNLKSNKSGKGKIDYVLWGDDGLPLAVIEAKKTSRDAKVGEHQAFEYAEALEEIYNFFPVRFCTNGYETYIYEEKNSVARRVYGFYRKEELVKLIKKREYKKIKQDILLSIDNSIAERTYQTRAITKVLENFNEGNRKSLLVMATGAGKTRVAISIVNSLSKLNMVNRTLFLADRISLVNQAMRNFKNFLPNFTFCNLVEEKDKNNAKILFSTYQTMASEVEKTKDDGTYKYGVGAFDLIIIDEAHRSVYQKYGDLFRYFDSLLLGLTATPKDEIDKNTFAIFEMENNKPTDSYDLFEAAENNFLVLPNISTISLNFPDNGIVYSKLSEEEKEEFESLFDEEEMPEEIEAESINAWFFNKDTTRQVIQSLMEKGYKIEEGDKIGKTIIFAKNDMHADHIVEVFNSMYKNNGNFCKKITTKVEKAQDLIDRFSNPKSDPQIAVSVDMLDTGIDIPEVLNLVFYKRVRSKTKFWQMIGRGTRLCPNIFGTGKNKKDFLIFDFCKNFEYFEMQDKFKEEKSKSSISLSGQIFCKKLKMIKKLQNLEYQTDEDYINLRNKFIDEVCNDIYSLNEDNISVKMRISYVREFKNREKIENLTDKDLEKLEKHISILPFKSIEKSEDEKRFENFILTYQLRILDSKNTLPNAEKLKDIYKKIADKGNIKEIRDNYDKISKVLKDNNYLSNLSILELEEIKKDITPLLVYLEPESKDYVFADFKDKIISEKPIDIYFGRSQFLNIKEKFQKYLEDNKDLLSIKKLKFNQELDENDIKELRFLLYTNDEIDLEEVEKEYSNELEEIKNSYETENNFSIFLRSLIGLDKDSLNKEFSKFLNKERFSGNQIELIEMIIKNFEINGAFNKKDLIEQSKNIIGVPLQEIFADKEDIIEISQIIDNINKKADFKIRKN